MNPFPIPPASPPSHDEIPGADLGSLESAARRQRGSSATAAPRGTPALDPRFLSSEQAARCYAEAIAAPGRTAPASLIQARAALAFAYELWDRPNPFARIRPPRRAGVAPAVGYLGAPDLARLLEALRSPAGAGRVTYGQSVVFYLAARCSTPPRATRRSPRCAGGCLWSPDGDRPPPCCASAPRAAATTTCQ